MKKPVEVYSNADPLIPERRNYVIYGDKRSIARVLDTLEHQPHSVMAFVATKLEHDWCARGYVRQDGDIGDPRDRIAFIADNRRNHAKTLRT